jgi:hypothetical protein
MSESYRQCGKCGKRALSFATRCPGCGIALPSPAPFEEGSIPDSKRALRMKVAMAVVASGVMLVLLARGPVRPAPLGAETSFVKPVMVEKPAMLGSVMAATRAPAPVGSARLEMTTAVAPTTTGGVPLIAKEWTHVRSGRTVNSTLEAVLTPGDTVVGDSLVNGWYRVALYGEMLGYAKEARLTPIEP